MSKVYHSADFSTTPPSKICKTCEARKPLDDFSIDKANRDGYARHCRDCYNRLQQERRHRPKEIVQLSLFPSKTCSICGVEKSLVDDFYPATFKDPRRKTKHGFKSACKDCHNNRNKESLAIPKNRAKRNVYHRKRNTRQEAKEYNRKWKIANRERIAIKRQAREAKRLLANPQMWSERYFAQKAKHYYRFRETTMRREARKRKATIGTVNYEHILERDGLTCHICNGSIDKDLHFDHIVPLSRGGEHTEDNIKPSHKTCNLRKNNKLMEELTPFDKRGPAA